MNVSSDSESSFLESSDSSSFDSSETSSLTSCDNSSDGSFSFDDTTSENNSLNSQHSSLNVSFSSSDSTDSSSENLQNLSPLRRRRQRETNSLTEHSTNVQAGLANNSAASIVNEITPQNTTPCTDQSSESYKCPVCLEPVRNREPTSTKCGHVFCNECIVLSLRSNHKCPICNMKLTVRQLNRLFM